MEKSDKLRKSTIEDCVTEINPNEQRFFFKLKTKKIVKINNDGWQYVIEKQEQIKKDVKDW